MAERLARSWKRAKPMATTRGGKIMPITTTHHRPQSIQWRSTVTIARPGMQMMRARATHAASTAFRNAQARRCGGLGSSGVTYAL